MKFQDLNAIASLLISAGIPAPTKAQVFSIAIQGLIDLGVSPIEAAKSVLGEQTIEDLVGEVWERLRAPGSEPVPAGPSPEEILAQADLCEIDSPVTFGGGLTYRYIAVYGNPSGGLLPIVLKQYLAPCGRWAWVR